MHQVADKHQLKIAKDTMRMSCVGARIMGGMDHLTAQYAIHRITGRHVPLHDDCTCGDTQTNNQEVTTT